jgi:hypothetical protein
MNQFKFFYSNLFLFLVLGFQQFVNAQGNTGYLAGTGIIWYQGDLSEKMDKVFSKTSSYKPFIRLGLVKRIFSHAEMSFNFMHGNVAADDAKATEKDNLIRNQSFKSSINELALHFEFSLRNLNRRPFINPFIYGGAGVFRFNPKAEYNGRWYELQPLGTEGQNISEVTFNKPYSLNGISFPVGVGIAFHPSPKWRIRLDYGHHKTNTDYIDDVSTFYVDSALLASAPYGQLTVALANRRLEPTYPPAGRSRGNSKMKDSYSHIGISVIYNPGTPGGGRGKRAGFLGITRRKHLINDSCPGF